MKKPALFVRWSSQPRTPEPGSAQSSASQRNTTNISKRLESRSGSIAQTLLRFPVTTAKSQSGSWHPDQARSATQLAKSKDREIGTEQRMLSAADIAMLEAQCFQS